MSTPTPLNIPPLVIIAREPILLEPIPPTLVRINPTSELASIPVPTSPPVSIEAPPEVPASLAEIPELVPKVNAPRLKTKKAVPAPVEITTATEEVGEALTYPVKTPFQRAIRRLGNSSSYKKAISPVFADIRSKKEYLTITQFDPLSTEFQESFNTAWDADKRSRTQAFGDPKQLAGFYRRGGGTLSSPNGVPRNFPALPNQKGTREYPLDLSLITDQNPISHFQEALWVDVPSKCTEAQVVELAILKVTGSPGQGNDVDLSSLLVNIYSAGEGICAITFFKIAHAEGRTYAAMRPVSLHTVWVLPYYEDSGLTTEPFFLNGGIVFAYKTLAFRELGLKLNLDGTVQAVVPDLVNTGQLKLTDVRKNPRRMTLPMFPDVVASASGARASSINRWYGEMAFSSEYFPFYVTGATVSPDHIYSSGQVRRYPLQPSRLGVFTPPTTSMRLQYALWHKCIVQGGGKHTEYSVYVSGFTKRQAFLKAMTPCLLDFMPERQEVWKEIQSRKTLSQFNAERIKLNLPLITRVDQLQTEAQRLNFLSIDRTSLPG